MFTKEECELIVDILDMWVDGLAPAEEATMEDPTIGDVDTFLTLVDGYREQREMIKSIKEKLSHVNAQ